MSQSSILYPLFGMFLLTMAAAVHLIRCRYRAVLQDSVKATHFKLNDNPEQLPGYLQQATQHYANLFEMPVLFYIVCVVIFVTGQNGVLALVLAWSYVLIRGMHSWIHLGKNKLRHRKNVFIVSTVVLVSLWCYTFIKLLFNDQGI